MSLLTDRLPVSYTICGKEYRVATDYRDILRIIDAFDDVSIPETQRGFAALSIFFSDIPEDIAAAGECLSDFVRCGKVLHRGTKSSDKKGADPDFSFSFDAGYIYAAFQTQYGIDLVDIDYLHWWKFRALFDGLETDRQLMEIRRCRARKITKDMSRAEKDYIMDMKKVHAIPKPQAVQEQIDAITAALLGDGDLSAVLE